MISRSAAGGHTARATLVGVPNRPTDPIRSIGAKSLPWKITVKWARIAPVPTPRLRVPHARRASRPGRRCRTLAPPRLDTGLHGRAGVRLPPSVSMISISPGGELTCNALSDVGGQLIVGTPKSHKSRTVPVPRFLARELAAVTAVKHADDLVFTTPGGHALRLSNWRRSALVPACSKAKVSDDFRIHDLRHTAASLMIQAGYPPKMLQEILGHASITTTLDLYGHLYPGDMDRYADRLDSAAGIADPAKIRPDEPSDDSQDGAASS